MEHAQGCCDVASSDNATSFDLVAAQSFLNMVSLKYYSIHFRTKPIFFRNTKHVSSVRISLGLPRLGNGASSMLVSAVSHPASTRTASSVSLQGHPTVVLYKSVIFRHSWTCSPAQRVRRRANKSKLADARRLSLSLVLTGLCANKCMMCNPLAPEDDT